MPGLEVAGLLLLVLGEVLVAVPAVLRLHLPPARHLHDQALDLRAGRVHPP